MRGLRSVNTVMFRGRSLSAIIPIPWRRGGGVLVVAIALARCSGGGAPEAPSRESVFSDFKTVVASADRDGYTPYWLGREFTAGGLVFQGPITSDLPGQVAGGGVRMEYNADLALRGSAGVVGLEVTVYSPAAWEKARSTQDGSATKYVRVAGQEAKLFLIAAGTRPVAQARLLLVFGNTTVLAIAGSGGPEAAGGPDVNPLIDETAFLAVMQNLRPYPQ